MQPRSKAKAECLPQLVLALSLARLSGAWAACRAGVGRRAVVPVAATGTFKYEGGAVMRHRTCKSECSAGSAGCLKPWRGRAGGLLPGHGVRDGHRAHVPARGARVPGAPACRQGALHGLQWGPTPSPCCKGIQQWLGVPHRPRPWSSLASCVGCSARALLHPSTTCCKAQCTARQHRSGTG